MRIRIFSAGVLTTVICAGEIWRSSRALGHQDHLPYHRSLSSDQRCAQGNTLLGKVSVFLTWTVSRENCLFKILSGGCGVPPYFPRFQDPSAELIHGKKYTFRRWPINSLMTWQLFASSVCKGPCLWPLMTGYLAPWSHDSECLFIRLVPFLWFTWIGMSLALAGESKKTGAADSPPPRTVSSGINLAWELWLAFLKRLPI